MWSLDSPSLEFLKPPSMERWGKCRFGYIGGSICLQWDGEGAIAVIDDEENDDDDDCVILWRQSFGF
jgi:hypothetical protein